MKVSGPGFDSYPAQFSTWYQSQVVWQWPRGRVEVWLEKGDGGGAGGNNSIRTSLMKRACIAVVEQHAGWDHILGSIARLSNFQQQSR